MLGTYVVETDGGLRVDAATTEGDDLATTEAGMLDVLTDGQGAGSRLSRGDGRGRGIGFSMDADATHAGGVEDRRDESEDEPRPADEKREASAEPREGLEDEKRGASSQGARGRWKRESSVRPNDEKERRREPMACDSSCSRKRSSMSERKVLGVQYSLLP